MFRAIGLLIFIYFLTKIFDQGFVAFEDATVASLQFVETAAVISSEQLEARRH